MRNKFKEYGYKNMFKVKIWGDDNRLISSIKSSSTKDLQKNISQIFKKLR